MRVRFHLLLLILVFFSCQPSVRYSQNNRTAQESEQVRTSTQNKLIDFVQKWKSTPYQFGGESKEGIDCSGFVMKLMLEVYHIHIPRQAQDQYINGEKISKSHIQPGNLIFFSISHGREVDHVGVYLGEGKFAHATATAGVIISDLAEEPYISTYWGACRY